MLQGIRHRDCGSCWQIEDTGATSLRGNSANGFLHYSSSNGLLNEFPGKSLQEISDLVTHDSEILNSHRPFMLEVSLGNTCDMKCMYCNHIYSSQWAVEGIKNKTLTIEEYKSAAGNPSEEFIELFWDWVNREAKLSLSRIGIIGGEPLITPDFYPFMDKLLECYSDMPNNKTAIWIVTNLNAEEKYFSRFIEYLPKISKKFNLEIHISMESLGKQAEYIRNGLDWDRFVNNVHKIFSITKNMENVTLAFQASINILSVPRYEHFLRWVHSLCIMHNKPVMLKQNIVTWPQAHTPFILPREYYQYLENATTFLSSVQNSMPQFPDVYGRWGEYNKFLGNLRDAIKNGGDGKIELRKSFHDWFNYFDNLRGLNFAETFPELADFHRQCGE